MSVARHHKRIAERGGVDKPQIAGGIPLEGEIRYSGAKNAISVTILAGTLLADGTRHHRQCSAPRRTMTTIELSRPHGRERRHDRRAQG